MQRLPTRFDEIKATGELPSPTGIALEILRQARLPETTAKDLTHVIQADPALTGKLLRLANSSYFGTSRRAASIGDAILRLGMRTVSSVSLAFSIVGASRRGVCRGFDYDRFWAASLARAVVCEALNRRLKLMSSEDGFTLGLLSHVGELALATIYPEQYSAILAQFPACAGRRTLLWDAERSTLGISSRDLSAAMLADWGLPEAFVDAIQAQCPPPGAAHSESRSGRLAAMLEAAGHIAEQCVVFSEPHRDCQALLASHLASLGIDDTDVNAFHQVIITAWQEWAPLLSVSTASLPAAAGAEPAPTDGRSLPTGEVRAAPLSVVVADDDELQCSLMCKMLETAGCDVRAARNGQEALGLVLQRRPDVVIADWQMPVLNGLDLCRTLRQSEFAQGVYLMLVTAAEDEEVLVAAYEAGVDDFVYKPVRPRAFQARMKAARRLIRLEAAFEAKQAEFRCVAGELAIANRKLEEAMLTDFLTGLPNRRYLMNRLEQEWSAAMRSGRELSCLLLDLDHFKQINDQHGHDVGDAVLQGLAALLRTHTRDVDTAARLGGEEFVVILPETPAGEARQIAERLRSAIEQDLVAAAPAVQATVTVSIGVATRTDWLANAESLLKAADEALYVAKSQGRNRVYCADSMSTCLLAPEMASSTSAVFV